MFQMGINKKITFDKHFARKYIRAYTNNLTYPEPVYFLSLLNICCDQDVHVYEDDLINLSNRHDP